ncbi:mitochondrial small ribosomal subunit protein uS17m, partial [Candidatus Berkelbacteria bacterium]|nr:mitochondrial small ribosomal subunit protein uS17m [Candidatus Berkelbacteria bacterium]
YQKSMTLSKRFLVHTGSDDYSIGSIVVIEPCRALSKNKHYRIFKQITTKGKKA